VSSPSGQPGRADSVARSVLRSALGNRLRGSGPDRTEALAQDGTLVAQRSASALDGGDVRTVSVTAPTVATFEGFLDGVQRSTVLAYLDGVPLLHGTAASVIRARTPDGRLRTWERPRITHAVYAPARALDSGTWQLLTDALQSRGQQLLDSGNAEPLPSLHPSALLRLAFDRLARTRDELERDVGQQWCSADANRPLYVDGSLRTSGAMQRAPGVVGVIKSHATVYGPPEALPLVLGLREAERTTLLVVQDDDGRPRYWTWYLRLRSAVGHDPFFGLIRVECGLRDAIDGEQIADTISQWLLAERAPIARPDPRWDVMPYAIRECEVYLRAVA
jgi:hypothetical protein